MYILFDIGGTHFRYYVLSLNYKIIYEDKMNIEDNILDQLKNYLNYIIDIIDKSDDYDVIDIQDIRVSIAGIVDNYRIYGCMNAGLNDGTSLMRNIRLDKYNINLDIIYLNDGDSFILGEIKYHEIQLKSKNILGIIFGTGVGCGLIMNGELVPNCEIHKYLESYMKENELDYSNIIAVGNFLANEFTKLIELLNLDYLIINGYINNYSLCQDIIIKYLSPNKYYNTKIIFSDCYLPIVNGLITL